MDNFKDELQSIAKMVLPEDANIAFAVDLCFTIYGLLNKLRAPSGLSTLRSFVRLLNSAYLLLKKHSILFPSALWAAYNVCYARQFKDTDTWGTQITTQVKVLCEKFGPLQEPQFLRNIATNTGEHILTHSRKLQAEAVLSCVDCNLPVLLEGPAAVGKTALIAFLCKVASNGTNVLERVNNTENTSVQDYLGSYLPFGNTFTFHKGALYRAMENGSYFLSDEFNLAEPAVLNMLFPLLEGKGFIQIPGTDKIVEAHPDFRFFATQNDAKYANRHQLPLSLRNRFVEVQVGDFPVDELPDIIAKRREITKKAPKQSIPAIKLAALYHAIKDTPLRITMREVIKWINRQALFEQPTWSQVGLSFLGQRFSYGSDNYKFLLENFERIWESVGLRNDVSILQVGDGVVFKEGQIQILVPGAQLARSPLWAKGRAPPPDSFQRILVRIAFAVSSGEPVLLIGPTSFKSLIVQTWAEIVQSNSGLQRVHLTPDTESSELIGQIQPYSFIDLVNQLPKMGMVAFSRYRSLKTGRKSSAAVSDLEQDAYDILDKLLPIQVSKIIEIQRLYSTTSAESENQNESDEFSVAQFEEFKQPEYLGAEVFESALESASIVQEEEFVQVQKDDSTEYDVSKWTQATDDFLDFDSKTFTTSSGEDILAGFVNIEEADKDDGFGTTYDDGFGAAENSDIIDDGFGTTGGVHDDGFGTTQTSSGINDDGFGVSLDTTKPETSADIFDDGFGIPDGADVKTGAIEDSATTTEKFGDSPKTENVTPVVDDGFGTESGPVESTGVVLGDDINFDDGFGQSDEGSSQIHDFFATADLRKYIPEVKIPNRIQEQEAPVWAEIRRLMKRVLAHFDILFSNLPSDATLQQMVRKLQSSWDIVQNENTDRSKPAFLFRDGPVTKAAKLGQLLLLEDFNLPSQAVTERLNSMLEPSPTFSVMEDITLRSLNAKTADLNVVLPLGFQVFATVHQETESGVVNLSPATRSRFTEIRVLPYGDKELCSIAQSEMSVRLSHIENSQNFVPSLVDLLFELRNVVVKDPQWIHKNDVQNFLRCVDFVCGHVNMHQFSRSQPLDFTRLVFIGARFNYFDEFKLPDQLILLEKFWTETYKGQAIPATVKSLFCEPTFEHGALDFSANSGPVSFPFEVLEDGNIQLKYLLNNLFVRI